MNILLVSLQVGEICNACMLLVKRFIKLPEDTDKNWNHVVDARSGPGIKSMVSGALLICILRLYKRNILISIK